MQDITILLGLFIIVPAVCNGVVDLFGKVRRELGV